METKVTKISYTNEITLISLSPPSGGAVAQVLSAFSEAGINVDMISQTAPQGGAVRMSFSLSDRDLANALTVLGKLRSGDKALSPEILPGNCKIAFYDSDMVHTPGVAAKVFALLSGANISIMLITTSDVDISILINTHDLNDALQIMSDAFKVEPVEAAF
jgi:aspartokinase